MGENESSGNHQNIRNLSIYPNPTESMLNFVWEASLDSKPVKLDIYDMKGQRIFTQQLDASTGKFSLNFSAMPKQVYMLHLHGENVNMHKRVTVH